MPITGHDRRAWGPRRRAAIAGVIFIAALVLAASFAMIGGPDGESFARPAAFFHTLARSGAPAAIYLAAAVGIGRILTPLFQGSRDAWPLQAALGLALMFTLSHALGVLGLLSMPVAAGAVAVGLALLAHQLARHKPAVEPGMPAWALLALPSAALLLVAACQPPGWLWESEGAGYDALEYHLQLPQEWLAIGRITPLEHNVYSYHPGYVESAFTHVAAMYGAGPNAIPSQAPFHGMLAYEGRLLLSCQFLHAGLTLIAAWMIARASAAAARACAVDHEHARVGGALGGALFLATPWTVVVGSLAYNEMGLLALGAASLIAALDPERAPRPRGFMVGLLVGAACACKPTALLFVGLPAAVLMLGSARPRHWPALIAAGSLAGIVMLAPWLFRNALHGGNPVFPMVSSLFGRAHWTIEQTRRFADAHTFHGGLLQRLALLVLPDPAADTPVLVSRHRGLMHPQWLTFFPAVAASVIIAAAARRTRRFTATLGISLGAQLAAWLLATHLQSRFLLPLAIPGCMLVALAATAGPARILPSLAAACIVAQLVGTVTRFAAERQGRPNALLVPGPGILSGQLFTSADEADQAGLLTPEALLNLTKPPGRVYLLGGATPLYLAVPLLYHTTWDRSPIGEAIRANPGDDSRWAAVLTRLGVRCVLVDFAELERLRRSGWNDPDVTPDAVRDWLGRHARLVHAWPQAGRYLFDLEGAP
jgi:hypothetical protein